MIPPTRGAMVLRALTWVCKIVVIVASVLAVISIGLWFLEPPQFLQMELYLRVSIVAGLSAVCSLILNLSVLCAFGILKQDPPDQLITQTCIAFFLCLLAAFMPGVQFS